MTLIVPMMIMQAKTTSRSNRRRKRQKRRDRAKVCYLGIRHMYDDIAYRKDDI